MCIGPLAYGKALVTSISRRVAAEDDVVADADVRDIVLCASRKAREPLRDYP